MNIDKHDFQATAVLVAAVVLGIALSLGRTPLSAQGKVILDKNITYGKGGALDLNLDLAYPVEGAGPFPALVFIGGGGWTAMSRNDYYPEIIQAATKGYVAVTVDYRVTSIKEKGKTKYPFPAQVYDVKCAVRWLRANADRYKIDRDHIGAVGFSAGGQLALMLGLTEPADGLEGECGNMKYSSRVQAVVNQSGPTELISLYKTSFAYLYELLGGTPEQVPEQYKKASPLTYVRKNSPPILTIHGENDLDVPLMQAKLLDAEMKEMGAPHTLIVRKGVGHSDAPLDDTVWEFLRKALTPSGVSVRPSHVCRGPLVADPLLARG